MEALINLSALSTSTSTQAIQKISATTFANVELNVSGAIWGQLTGTLSNQTDLQSALDLKANTSQLHNAVTVTDTAEIDFTLTGQDIQASIVAASIDETKLDTSVNASLDLADSALQSLAGAVLTDQTVGQTVGLTGARLTKLWATDITVTNAITGSVTGNAGTVTNATLTTALTVNTGTLTLTAAAANSSVLTIGAGAVSVSGSNTGDNAVNTSSANTALSNLASVAMNASLQWDNTAARTFDIAATANTVVGRALAISAGSTVTAGTADMAGGDLTLNSGLGKGTGASSIIFQTGRTLTTGSTLQTLTTAMTILGNGNVGIGTTGPGSKLSVEGYSEGLLSLTDRTTLAADIGPKLEFNSNYRTGDLTPTGSGWIKSGKTNATSNDHSFYMAFATRLSGGAVTERMRIDNTGNVGIGTTAPESQLQVGSATFSANHKTGILFTGSVSAASPYLTAGIVSVPAYGTGSTNLADVTGFYTSPGTKGTSGTIATSYGLLVDTNALVTTNSYGIKVVSPTGGATANYGIMVTGTGINSFAGNVGIGTTDPTSKLHLAAGTATAGTAPLGFTSGTLLTTAVAGKVEFLTDKFYGTITTGAVRKTFAFLESPAFTGRVLNSTVTTLANDGTPTVAASNLFITGGTTAITDFDDGVVGQTIQILSAHAITITDGAPIILNGSANFVMAAGDSLTLTMFNDQVWNEVSRMVNL